MADEVMGFAYHAQKPLLEHDAGAVATSVLKSQPGPNLGVTPWSQLADVGLKDVMFKQKFTCCPDK